MLSRQQFVFGIALLLASIGDSGAQSEQQLPSPNAQTETAQNQPATDQRGSEQSPFIIKMLPATENKPDTTDNAKACDEKAEVDRQLLYATWALAALALLQFFALCAQAFYLARTITHGRRVERAYVSGGGSFLGRVGRNIETGEDIVEMTNIFQVTVDNYGKTPARIISIDIGFCNSNNIPPEPRFTLNEFFNGVIPPNEKGAPTPIRLPTDQILGDVIFGRFNYETVFRRWFGADRLHHAGFVLRIVDRGVRPINAPRAYWDWN
jgi:hypothetical protein